MDLNPQTQTQVFAVFSLVGTVSGLLLGLASYRQSTRAQRTAKGTKELEEAIKSAIDNFETRITDKLAQTYATKEAMGQIHYDVAARLDGKYVQKEFWVQYNLGQDTRFTGIDHRIKRNTDQISMLLGIVFELMSHTGLRTNLQKSDISKIVTPDG